MSLHARIAQSMRNPKVLAGTGAAAIALVLIARGAVSGKGAGGEGAAEAVAPAPSADPFGNMLPSGGLAFATTPTPTVTSEAEEGLHVRFNELSDVVGGLGQTLEDLKAQRVTPAKTTTPPKTTVTKKPLRQLRWTPGPGSVVGRPLKAQPGLVFAGWVKLTNGERAPLVRYLGTGIVQIHPTWLVWMAANNVKRDPDVRPVKPQPSSSPSRPSSLGRGK